MKLGRSELMDKDRKKGMEGIKIGRRAGDDDNGWKELLDKHENRRNQ